MTMTVNHHNFVSDSHTKLYNLTDSLSHLKAVVTPKTLQSVSCWSS